MDLDSYLREYKALTLDIMERVNIDGSIEYLLEERQYILDKMKIINFNQSDMKGISQSLGLIELERELHMLINSEKNNIKTKIGNLKKMQTANMNYASIGYTQSIFNKKS